MWRTLPLILRKLLCLWPSGEISPKALSFNPSSSSFCASFLNSIKPTQHQAANFTVSFFFWLLIGPTLGCQVVKSPGRSAFENEAPARSISRDIGLRCVGTCWEQEKASPLPLQDPSQSFLVNLTDNPQIIQVCQITSLCSGTDTPQEAP